MDKFYRFARMEDGGARLMIDGPLEPDDPWMGDQGVCAPRAFREALSAYEDNPPLTELEQGFESIELTAFSKDRVAVCKYYKEQEPQKFYLMVADHFIVVYEEDRSTLYMNTDILLERLPDALQREIMEGKLVASEEELYLFLESYSS